MNTRQVSAVLLAGGQSKRMGRDKALLPWEGWTLLQHVHAQLCEAFDEVLVASGDAARYAALGILGVGDAPPFQGPMAGLAAAFAQARHPIIYVHPCDSPQVDLGMVDSLLGAIDGYEAAVLRNPNGVQPLCAVYRRDAALAAFAACAQEGRFALHTALGRLRVVELVIDYSPSNLNLPDDVEKYSGE